MIKRLANPKTELYRQCKEFIVDENFPWYFTRRTLAPDYQYDRSKHREMSFLAHSLLVRPHSSTGHHYPIQQSEYLEHYEKMLMEIFDFNEEKVGCFFRPNYERGILMYYLVRKLEIKSVLEIGFGRGYATFCMAKAMCDHGIDGKIGEEPAGPNLMKKIKAISKDKKKKKTDKEMLKSVSENTCIHCGNIMDENLKKWFSDRWVNIGKKKKGGGHPPCGTSGKKRGYAKCVPASKAARMTDKQKKSATRRKRAAQNKAGRGGTSSLKGGGKKPIMVSTKPKKRGKKKS